MTNQSTIHYERTSPQIAKITFANPPVNFIVGETVLRLVQIVDELAGDPDIQVVVFDSGVPDFFFNHFDLAAAADFPAPEGEDAVPVWTDLVLKLSKAPYMTIATIRGRTRGGGNDSPLRSTCAMPAVSTRSLGSPRWASACCLAGAAPNGSRARSDATAPWRPSSPATTTTQTRRSGGAGSPRALPDSELDAFVGRHRCTPRILRPHIARRREGDDQQGGVAAGRGPCQSLRRVCPLAHPTRFPLPRCGLTGVCGPGRPRPRVPARGIYRHRQPRSLTTGRAQWRGSSACSLSCCFTKACCHAKRGAAGWPPRATSLNASSPPHVNSSTRTASMRSPRNRSPTRPISVQSLPAQLFIPVHEGERRAAEPDHFPHRIREHPPGDGSCVPVRSHQRGFGLRRNGTFERQGRRRGEMKLVSA